MERMTLTQVIVFMAQKGRSTNSEDRQSLRALASKESTNLGPYRVKCLASGIYTIERNKENV